MNDWIQLLEKIIFAVAGGLAAYWFAHHKFLSQRLWDKKFELISETITVLKELTHALAILHGILASKTNQNNNVTVKTIAIDFENALSRLHSLQGPLLLVSLDNVKNKLLPIYAALQMVNPIGILEIKSDEEYQEVSDLFKQSQYIVEGCSGEVAFLGRKELKIK